MTRARRMLVLGPDTIRHLTPLWNSVRLLCEHGYTVDLFSARHDSTHSPYRNDLLRVHSKAGPGALNGARYRAEAITAVLRRPAAVWIHSPAMLKHPLTAIAHAGGMPIIYHAHELFDRDTHGQRLRWAQLIICPEAKRAEMLRSWAGEKTRILVLPNSRFPRQWKPSGRLRDRLAAHDVNVELVCIYQGLIATRRNIAELIDAMEHVDRNVGLVLLGDGSEEDLAACDSRIASKGLTHRAIRLPAVGIDEVLEFAADADIGILFYQQSHSLNNRLCAPNKLFEYMMVGLPMVGTDCPGLRPFIGGFDLGESVDSSDPADIARGINALARDCQRRSEIAERARSLFANQYHYDALAQPVMEFCETEL